MIARAFPALLIGLALAGPVLASDVGYIYGRVEMVGGEKYRGPLRWGTEESFWDDIFNATKAENEHVADVDRRARERIRDRKASGWNLFGASNPNMTHLFAVRFGDLKRLHVRSADGLIAEFRNGEQMRLKGGSNDVGAKITVVDPRAGTRELAWNRIRTIEFLETPEKLEDKLGEPIYGTVRSGSIEYTGRIQWDHDETLTADELDGTSDGGKVSFAFGKIAAIRKHRSGALVRLRSGREVYLRGSNDVNSENRGVVVIAPHIGTVKIGWDDFDEVTFQRAPNSGRSYAGYAEGSDLRGTVVTRNGRHAGRLVFDLDESWDFEMLHGRNGDTEYLIPFREIASIRPQGRLRSEVQLRVGLVIELDESQDVTRKNDGLLVYAGEGRPTYVEWRNVSEVRFR